MKEKYVEERYPRWHTMGSQGDISTPTEIGFAFGLELRDAKVICEAHNEVVAVLAQMADAWDNSDPEGFKAFWYGSSE